MTLEYDLRRSQFETKQTRPIVVIYKQLRDYINGRQTINVIE